MTQHHPDVVLLDIQLPDLSGLELFQKVRQVDATIPVIFITASGSSGTAIEAMKLGAFDYLLKPLDFPKVRELVARAFEIRRFMHVPVAMAERYPYEANLRASAALAARAAGFDEWALVYQSRSGRPEDPWLEPDVCDYLRAERDNGLEAVVLCPIGFLCDHIEVLFDLDVEAAAVCRDIGLPMARASTVNVHPRFIEALADAVFDVWRRYEEGRPLAIAGPASRV